MTVILSASEIYRDPSEKYVHLQFFGGILHFVQNDRKQNSLPPSG